jgi:predicted acylesterase/phospholipase RssA
MQYDDSTRFSGGQLHWVFWFLSWLLGVAGVGLSTGVLLRNGHYLMAAILAGAVAALITLEIRAAWEKVPIVAVLLVMLLPAMGVVLAVNVLGTRTPVLDVLAVLVSAGIGLLANLGIWKILDDFGWNDGRRAYHVITITCFVLALLVAPWMAITMVDLWTERHHLPFAREKAENTPWDGLAIGLALSGGGYRAALMHAGVLDALDRLRVPITTIASVSGGSIIASYYVAGGRPRDFLTAAAAQRFLIVRDLADLSTALRFLLAAGDGIVPAFEFSRLHLQADVVDRVLLRQLLLRGLPNRPRLIIGVTDLVDGKSLGLTRIGVVVRTLATAVNREEFENAQRFQAGERRYFVPTSDADFPGSARVSLLVAASGAFPLAFPPLRVELRQEQMLLADGGLRDNSAMTLLILAGVLANEDSRLEPYRSEFLIASDAGATLREKSGRLSNVDQFSQAMDIIYADVGRHALKPPPQSWLLSPSYQDLIGTVREALETAVGQHCYEDVASILRNSGIDTAQPLVRVVTDIQQKMHRQLTVFANFSTVSPYIKVSDANALYELGQLLVALEWPGIRQSLNDRASQTSHRVPNGPRVRIHGG